MKLYVWLKLAALKDYGEGLAFAHADSIDIALSMIIKNYTEYNRDMFGYFDYVDDRIKEFTEEIKQTEPEIYESEFSLFQFGSQ